MSESKVLYVCFRRDAKGAIKNINAGMDRTEVENRPDHKDDERFITIGNKEDVFEEDSENLDAKQNDKSLILMNKSIGNFFNAISPFHKLIDLTTFFRQGLQRAGMEEQFYTETKKIGRKLKSKQENEIYSVPVSEFGKLQKHIDSMEEIDTGMRILPSSILLSMVATFDSGVSDYCKIVLSNLPVKNSLNEKTLTYEKILSFATLEDAKSHLINEEVNKLNRSSHQEQVQYLERLSGTEIAGAFTKWPQFLEIFERRNVYAHANGIANSYYITNLKTQKALPRDVKEGDRLNLKSRYLHESVDCLIEFGVLLTFVTWAKNSDEKEEIVSSLNAFCMFLISHGRFRLSRSILEFALFKQSRKGVSEIVIRMMYVNLANACRKMDDRDQAQKYLDELDWSASSLKFQICIESIKGNVDEVCRLLPASLSSGDITAENIGDWPAFDWVRKDSKFVECLKEQTSENGAAGSEATVH